ncbi:hypothetical protein J7L48_04115 [bacterium]|nr:hypothetical protein [bacterium]
MIVFLLIISIVGGILSIEGLVWGKFMVSRPVIFVPAIVIILSAMNFFHTESNLIILLFFLLSILIELRLLFTIPVGSSFVPDTITGTLGIFFLAALLPKRLDADNFYSILLFLYMMVFSLSYISGYFDVLFKRFNTVLVEYGKKLLSDGEFYGFENLSKFGYILFFVKGFLLTLTSGALIYLFFKLILPLLNSPSINKFSIVFLITVLSRFAVNLFIHWRIFKNSLLNFIVFIFIIIMILQFHTLGLLIMLLIFCIYLILEIKRFNNG